VSPQKGRISLDQLKRLAGKFVRQSAENFKGWDDLEVAPHYLNLEQLG